MCPRAHYRGAPSFGDAHNNHRENYYQNSYRYSPRQNSGGNMLQYDETEQNYKRSQREVYRNKYGGHKVENDGIQHGNNIMPSNQLEKRHATSSLRRRGGGYINQNFNKLDHQNSIPFCSYFSNYGNCRYGDNCRYRHDLKRISNNLPSSTSSIICCAVGKLEDGQVEIYTVSHKQELIYWGIIEDTSGVPQILLKKTIELHEKATSCVFFSDCIFCAFSKGDILVLHRTSGDSRILKGHTSAVYSLLFVDNILISGGWDGSVRFWEFDNNEGVFRCIKVVMTECSISFMKELSTTNNEMDIKRSLWIAGSALVILDLQRLEVSKKIDTEDCISVALVKFEDTMLVGFAAGFIRTYNKDGDLLSSYSTAFVSSMQGLLVNDHPILLFGTNEGTFHAIGLPSFKEYGSLSSHKNFNIKHIVDIGSNHWLSCGEDGSICIWKWLKELK